MAGLAAAVTDDFAYESSGSFAGRMDLAGVQELVAGLATTTVSGIAFTVEVMTEEDDRVAATVAASSRWRTAAGMSTPTR